MLKSSECSGFGCAAAADPAPTGEDSGCDRTPFPSRDTLDAATATTFSDLNFGINSIIVVTITFVSSRSSSAQPAQHRLCRCRNSISPLMNRDDHTPSCKSGEATLPFLQYFLRDARPVRKPSSPRYPANICGCRPSCPPSDKTVPGETAWYKYSLACCYGLLDPRNQTDPKCPSPGSDWSAATPVRRYRRIDVRIGFRHGGK